MVMEGGREGRGGVQEEMVAKKEETKKDREEDKDQTRVRARGIWMKGCDD